MRFLIKTIILEYALQVRGYSPRNSSSNSNSSSSSSSSTRLMPRSKRSTLRNPISSAAGKNSKCLCCRVEWLHREGPVVSGPPITWPSEKLIRLLLTCLLACLPVC
ncbi:hypothetical protein M0804_011871 [Polistes exclamans]|nr:hypothetical protein M0804_011871 [Polistes exclamans]